MSDLRSLVFEALNNAKENGADPRRQPAQQTASELAGDTTDLGTDDPEAILPFVHEWLVLHAYDQDSEGA